MKQIAIIALLLLSACDQTPGTQPIADSPDKEYAPTARFIGTVDGCRLWSVQSGQFYFANCRGGTTSTGWIRSSGKTSHYYAATTDYSE